jgi:hemolysin activation/secretion protein
MELLAMAAPLFAIVGPLVCLAAAAPEAPEASRRVMAGRADYDTSAVHNLFMLATRIGGRRVFGEYPWFESAFIGGSKSLRGYRKNRFAGDGSLYGSLEVRLWLFRGKLIAPGRWGVFGLTDAGRVFLEGDSTETWHASYGGGIFFQMLTLNSVFHAAVAQGDEGTRFYVDYGFGF